MTHPSSSRHGGVARLLALAAWAAFSFGCAPTPVRPESDTPAIARARADVDCGTTISGADRIESAGGLILLGEMHGSMEIPAFVGSLACQAAAAGIDVRLGLEIPRREASAVAAYLASAGTVEDRAMLLAGKHWQSAGQDGRASVAMLALIERVRALQADGVAIDLFLFDVDRYSSSNERDAEMAAAILAEGRAHPRALVMTLSGNVHARTAAGRPWDPAAVPMGSLVRVARPDVIALDVRHGGGAIWACQQTEGGELTFGPMTLASRDTGEVPRIELTPARDEAGFDGTFWLRELSPAPPAIER